MKKKRIVRMLTIHNAKKVLCLIENIENNLN